MNSVIHDFIKLTGYEVETVDSPSISKISARYLELLEDYKKGGAYPIIVSISDILIEKFELDLEDEHLDRKDFKKLIHSYLEKSKNMKVEDVISSKSKEEVIEEIRVENLQKIAENPVLEPMVSMDYEGNIKDDVVIVKLSNCLPYEVFAYLPIGGFNDCPLPSEMVAVSKYWYEKYGAMPCGISYDEVEYYLEEKILDKEAIKELVAEQFLYDVDIVDQCFGSFEKLADSLYGNNQWYFWWD